MFLGLSYGMWAYFLAQMYLTIEITRRQAQAAADAGDAQTEMAEENARLQNEMQEKAQEQNIEKSKQLSLAEDMERQKLNDQKLKQDIAFRQAYGTNVAGLGDYSMTGNTVNRIFGTIDRRLTENKLNIDRDIETLGTNFAFARDNLQTQTDMGLLGSDMNINAFKTGEHMGMDSEAAFYGTGASWMSSWSDSYRLSRKMNPSRYSEKDNFPTG